MIYSFQLTHRMTYLLQHLEGEAMRAVQCFSNDKMRYIMALKRLKYILCTYIYTYMYNIYTYVIYIIYIYAYIKKMIRGKQIGNDDNETLVEYYYAVTALWHLVSTTTHLICSALIYFNK